MSYMILSMQIRNSKDYVYGEELIAARFVDTENLTDVSSGYLSSLPSVNF